jgi:hypothetical protein
VRHALIAVAVATYLFDPEDAVWRFVRDSPVNRLLERGFFLAATLLIGVGAVLCTRASASVQTDSPPSRSLVRQHYFGEFFYAAGFASLLPLLGFVLLVCGEGVRLLRLMASDPIGRPKALQASTGWFPAFREQSAKWGIFVSMIVFTITLTDRLIEILACLSGALWAVLNLPAFWRCRT